MSLQEVHLNNLSSTTTPVDGKNPTKANANAPVKPAKVDNHIYYLQMASLRDVDQAMTYMQKINAVKKLGKNKAHISEVHKKGSVWYVVKLGPFKTKNDTENVQGILDRYYYSGMIFRVEVSFLPPRLNITFSAKAGSYESTATQKTLD